MAPVSQHSRPLARRYSCVSRTEGIAIASQPELFGRRQPGEAPGEAEDRVVGQRQVSASTPIWSAERESPESVQNPHNIHQLDNTAMRTARHLGLESLVLWQPATSHARYPLNPKGMGLEDTLPRKVTHRK